MGGFGSSRWGKYRKRRAVDHATVLDVNWLLRLMGLAPGKKALSTLRWDALGFPNSIATSKVLVDLVDTENATIALVTRFDEIEGESVQEIKVEFTRICSGGLRPWLFCPKCSRRGTRLYMPPDESQFLCRDCHDLTYRSAQATRRVNIVDKIAAAQLGVTVSEAAFLLSDLSK